MIKRRRGRTFDLSVSVSVRDDDFIVLNTTDYKAVMTSEYGNVYDVEFTPHENVAVLHFLGIETEKWDFGRYKFTLIYKEGTREENKLDVNNLVELVRSTSEEKS